MYFCGCSYNLIQAENKVDRVLASSEKFPISKDTCKYRYCLDAGVVCNYFTGYNILQSGANIVEDFLLRSAQAALARFKCDFASVRNFVCEFLLPEVQTSAKHSKTSERFKGTWPTPHCILFSATPLEQQYLLFALTFCAFLNYSPNDIFQDFNRKVNSGDNLFDLLQSLELIRRNRLLTGISCIPESDRSYQAHIYFVSSLYEVIRTKSERNGVINKMSDDKPSGQTDDRKNKNDKSKSQDVSKKNDKGKVHASTVGIHTERVDKSTDQAGSSLSLAPATTANKLPNNDKTSNSQLGIDSNQSEAGKKDVGSNLDNGIYKTTRGSTTDIALPIFGSTTKCTQPPILENCAAEDTSNTISMNDSKMLLQKPISMSSNFSSKTDVDLNKEKDKTDMSVFSTVSGMLGKSSDVINSFNKNINYRTNNVTADSDKHGYVVVSSVDDDAGKDMLIDLENVIDRSTPLTSSSDNASMSADVSMLTPLDKRLEEVRTPSGWNTGSIRSPAEENLMEMDRRKGTMGQTFEEALNMAINALSSLGQTRSFTDVESIPTSSSSTGCAQYTNVDNSKLKKYESRLLTSDEDINDIRTYLSPHSSVSASSPHEPDSGRLSLTHGALRRSSSLTAPNESLSHKKAVHFADSMGLDLESVRHVLDSGTPPIIPPSVFANLMINLEERPMHKSTKYLYPSFSQPGASLNFIYKVRSQKISLENVIVTDMTINGFVRVANISPNKHVRVRYTINAWSSYYEIDAIYINNSCDGPTDRFTFTVTAPTECEPGSRMELALFLICDGVKYWDNNNGDNYIFYCFVSSPTVGSQI